MLLRLQRGVVAASCRGIPAWASTYTRVGERLTRRVPGRHWFLYNFFVFA